MNLNTVELRELADFLELVNPGRREKHYSEAMALLILRPREKLAIDCMKKAHEKGHVVKLVSDEGDGWCCFSGSTVGTAKDPSEAAIKFTFELIRAGKPRRVLNGSD